MTIKQVFAVFVLFVFLVPFLQPAHAQEGMCGEYAEVESDHVLLCAMEGYEVLLLNPWHEESALEANYQLFVDFVNEQGLAETGQEGFEDWVSYQLLDLEIVFSAEYEKQIYGGFVHYYQVDSENSPEEIATTEFVRFVEHAGLVEQEEDGGGPIQPEILIGPDLVDREAVYAFRQITLPGEEMGAIFAVIYYPDFAEIVTVYAIAPMSIWLESSYYEEMLIPIVSITTKISQLR